MGFSWYVSISLQYCVPIKLDDKVSVWYMLKRLAEYEPGYAKRAHQAMTTNDPMGTLLLKKAMQSVIVMTDSAEYDENEMDKEAENPTPLELRFHYHPSLGECGGPGGREFMLQYNNPEILQEAFEYAASKILGVGHGISLEFMHGGAYGNADACSKEKALFLTYKPLTRFPDGKGIQACRGGSNMPWGVYSMAFPTAPPGDAFMNIHRLISAFGYIPDGEIGWRVITVANGG